MSELEKDDAEAEVLVELIAKARELGGNAADSFWDEFEETPSRENVGDWDASAWSTHWHELKDAGAIDTDHEDMLDAWRGGFWGGRNQPGVGI